MKTVAKEMTFTTEEGQQFSTLNMDFYLPLPGQPHISKVCAWRDPICTEQGNGGIYVQVDDWKEQYGTNVYMVDEVMGRIYAEKNGELQWTLEI